jgi:hypothetical protein
LAKEVTYLPIDGLRWTDGSDWYSLVEFVAMNTELTWSSSAPFLGEWGKVVGLGTSTSVEATVESLFRNAERKLSTRPSASAVFSVVSSLGKSLLSYFHSTSALLLWAI